MPARSAIEDLSAVELDELIRKSRYFVKNSPLVKRLKSLFAQYTAGIDGQKIIPTTSDREFNRKARKAWRQFCKRIEITGKDYGTCADEGANALFSDGGYFIRKTFREVAAKRGQPRLIPAIQMIERQQVRNPDDAIGKSIFNGIQLGSNGVTGYWIAERNGDEQKVSFYPRDQIIHVYDSTRPGSIDGVPMLSESLNRLHDLDDLQILQMKKAKQHARIANVITTENGELPSDDDVLKEAELGISTQDGTGAEKTEDRLREYQRAHGGEWMSLKSGEDMKQIASVTPSITEQWHWRKTESEVCASVGISLQIVFPESLQGTVARGDLEVTASTLRGFAALQGAGWIGVYQWFLEWGIKNLPELSNPPEDYLECKTQPPRAINVDIGWNSESVRKEIESGLRSFSRTYAELDLDFEEELDLRAQEARMIRDKAAELGLDVADISILLQDRAEIVAKIKADSMAQSAGAFNRNDPASVEDAE